MTHDLHDRLDDLVTDVPAYVVPDARAAWSAGARRRTRHRLAVGAALVVLAVLASAVAWLPRTLALQPVNPDGAGVDGHPARVVDPWVTHDLPTSPGPMSMVYNRDGATWWAADAEGRSWPVPQGDVVDNYPPALSPDGTMLGYLAGRRSFVIQDLVTGAQTEFSDLGDGGTGLPEPQWFVGAQSPAFWSPDGERLLLRVGGLDPASEDTTALVLTRDGTMTQLDDDNYPAGWLDNDTIAWVRPPTGDLGARLVAVDLQGRVQSRVELDLRPRMFTMLSQWSASVSPDGSQVAVTADDGDVRLLSTSDGSVIDSRPMGADDNCGISWQDGIPVVMTGDSLVSTIRGTVTTFDPDVYCALAAASALGGEAHPGTSRWWLASVWVAANGRLIGLGVVFVGAIVVLRLIGRRRRALARTS